MKNYKDFTGLYPLSKTIRFELKPVGATLEHIHKLQLLPKEKEQKENYKKLKTLLDNYHRNFIEQSLKKVKLKKLEVYNTHYYTKKKRRKNKEIFHNISKELREEIAHYFTKNKDYTILFNKKLFTHGLQNITKNQQEKELLNSFMNSTGYFKNYHENRKNLYRSDKKITSIASRIIDNNLPRFIDNLRVFEKVKDSPIGQHFKQLFEEIGSQIQVSTIEDVFTLNYFNQTLTQSGITAYNNLLAGIIDENDKKKKGLNEYISLYNQSVVSKSKKIGKLKPLRRQILSDVDTIINKQHTLTDQNIIESIKELYDSICSIIDKDTTHGVCLPSLLYNIRAYKLEGIYLKNDTSLIELSTNIFGKWDAIKEALENLYDKEYDGNMKQDSQRYLATRKKYLKEQDSFSIAFLNKALESTGKSITSHFESVSFVNEEGESVAIFQKIKTSYIKAKHLFTSTYPKDKRLLEDKKNIGLIKELLDSIKALQWFIKPLRGSGDEPDKEERFYGDFLPIWDIFTQVTPTYNKIRSYITRKPYSIEKIKQNFNNPNLLCGWNSTNESTSGATILKKGTNYFLAIQQKSTKSIFQETPIEITKEYFQKMEYSLLPCANRLLPKVFFSKLRQQQLNPPEELIQNYKKETHKVGENFNLDHCHQLIDFFKNSIPKIEMWKHFQFSFSATSTYSNLRDFYQEVEQQGYKINFSNVSCNYINQMIEEGKLFLFRIYNKDFSEKSKGLPNLHSLYWKMIFAPENINNVCYKLNGQAEMFYRKASITANSSNIYKAKSLIRRKQHEQSPFVSYTYDIIKDKRFTSDKFLFHVPITLNFTNKNITNLNTLIHNYIKKNDNLNIIGIDRGEKHLLYICIIDLEGNIKKQFSLNEITHNNKSSTITTNYQKLLKEREDKRNNARQNWLLLKNIKELKEGYLSNAVHKITQLIIENNALVILEDLSDFFKKSRQGKEKQIYQKFEKMLIDKLNYLVIYKKEEDKSAAGGALKAYQLTNPFKGFKRIGKQSGILFYVPAWKTSNIDPSTGFVNLFNLKYININKSKEFFNKFDIIAYKDKLFQFSFNYNHFVKGFIGCKEKWTVYSYGDRIEKCPSPDNSHLYISRMVELTPQFKALFKQYQISYKSKNLKDKIVAQNEKGFFEKLIHLFNLTMQLRNGSKDLETDFLISPVLNDDNQFYDSRNAGKDYPQNADANGAYNIARKGLMLVQKIKKSNNEKIPQLTIANREWLQFTQKENKSSKT